MSQAGQDAEQCDGEAGHHGWTITARVDHYRVYDDDVWATISTQRLPILDRYQEVVGEGADLIGGDTREAGGSSRPRRTSSSWPPRCLE